MARSNSPTALIVGAGIGGLAAAIALGRAGWRTRIFERAPDTRALGFGLVLAPNAMAALDELGLAADVAAIGVRLDAVEIRRLGGQLLRRFDRPDRFPERWPTTAILRPALRDRLLAAVAPDVLMLSREAVDSEDGPDPSVRFAAGGTERGDILVGADGVGSAICRSLHPDAPPPRPSGFCSVRGVAHGLLSPLGGLSMVAYLGPGVEAAMVRSGAHAVYWYMSLLAAELTGGWVDIRALLAALGFDPAFREIVEVTHPNDVRFDRLLERRPLRTWGRGRVTLLGDAAHPMLPHTGQGAAQALEDAVALGLALAADGDPVTALRRYEEVRSVRTRRVVNMGPRLARISTTRSRVIGGLRNAAVRTVPTALLAMGMQVRSDPHAALRRSAQ